jgi:hypothetical protein
MEHTAPTPTRTAPEEIAAGMRLILAGLWVRILWWGLEVPLVVHFQFRATRIVNRIERMLKRFRAGKLKVGVKRTRKSVVRSDQARERRKPSVVIPRRYGWLVIAGKHHAAGAGSQLQHLLSQPDMAELLEAAPQARRLLKPLCRALMVELPWVNPSPKPRAKKPRQPRKRTYAIASDFNPPLPRGVLAWARKEGFGKRPKD